MSTRAELIRFFTGGVIAGAVDFGVYLLLIHYFPFSVAKGISFTCGGIVAFMLNKYWIFVSNKSISPAEVGRYVIINVLALGVNVGVNQGVLTVWPEAILPALIAASMMTGLITYCGFKWLVFRVPVQLSGPLLGD